MMCGRVWRSVGPLSVVVFHNVEDGVGVRHDREEPVGGDCIDGIVGRHLDGWEELLFEASEVSR